MVRFSYALHSLMTGLSELETNKTRARDSIETFAGLAQY